MNLLAIFITGLTTGGLSCLAVQGGLLASIIANQKEEERKTIITGNKKENLKKYFTLKNFDTLDWMPVLIFLIAKLVSHTILGVFLGFLGSVVSLSLGVRIAFQVFTALFMLATAMNLLKVHPIFRYVSFAPPKFLQKMVVKSSKRKAFFAPAVLGFLTIFIPCGVTQAMEVLAINSGNPIQGALIMFFFVLGTFPLFGFLGVATAKLAEGWYKTFTKVASIALIIMALYIINASLVAAGFSVDKYVGIFSSKNNLGENIALIADQKQKVTIQILNNGYKPNNFKVKSGIPVELTLKSTNTYSCALAFVFREFGINTYLGANDTKTFVFTPTKKGKFQFSCSMGMYRGVMEVI